MRVAGGSSGADLRGRDIASEVFGVDDAVELDKSNVLMLGPTGVTDALMFFNFSSCKGLCSSCSCWVRGRLGLQD